MKFSQVKEDLEKLDVGEMIEDEPMYKHTTYKVGGPALLSGNTSGRCYGEEAADGSDS